jgi:hypothetical protein
MVATAEWYVQELFLQISAKFLCLGMLVFYSLKYFGFHVLV